ncbi:MAG: hypothetical protein PHP42_10570 [Bacteroidota bacterium]|nr:hypothetical protein [Bacteroidota bacterium]
MPIDNYTRMIQLADEFFASKKDPAQLDIDEQIITQLKKIHPAAMGELTDDGGPVAWTIVIPTTHDIMQQFLEKKISEKNLFDLTLHQSQFGAVYLCSALVLPEYRRKGFAKQLLCSSVRTIQQTHLISELFYWAFSTEGDTLAHAVASELHLPLLQRTE